MKRSVIEGKPDWVARVDSYIYHAVMMTFLAGVVGLVVVVAVAVAKSGGGA